MTDTLLQGLNDLRVLFNKVFQIDHSDFDEIISNISEDEAKLWSVDKYFKTLAGVDGITINTIHQSKGLEYEVVLLNGINENRLPHQRLIERIGNNWIFAPLTKEDLENGRTLLYVGMSRAKALLIITHNWRPSLFIPTIRATNN